MLISREQIRRNHARLQKAIGEKDPELSAGMREVADRAVEGVIGFHHLARHWTKVGRSGIDWSAPQHKHQEWPAQLNRFFQLPSLATAYACTRDEKYAQAAHDYVAGWIAAHPSREGWTIARYDNTLNLSIRVDQWLVSLPRLMESPSFDDSLVDEMVRSICAQHAFLMEHLTGWGNWRIAQADSLLSAGIRLDGLPDAERWRTAGVRLLNDAFHRQVLPDGAHIERNPGYHTWMAHVFASYWHLGKAMPELGLTMQADAIARMYDYGVAVRLPNGSYNNMHDSLGARTGRGENDAIPARKAFRKEAGLPEVPPPTSQFFPHAGQALMRDGWGEDATYVTFDATTWGGGHCHLSRNAVQLHAFGRTLVLDPGYFTYETSDPFMRHGRSTRAHNTLSLNGWNQSEADPENRFACAPGYDLVEATYDGSYWPSVQMWGRTSESAPGIYAEHYRAVLWVHGRCVVVIDGLACPSAGQDKPSLENNWQLCEGPVETDPSGEWAATHNDDANVLLLFPLKLPGMKLSVHEGEANPLRGWLPGEGKYVPAPQVSLALAQHTARYSDLATVLIPFKGPKRPKVSAQARGLYPGGVGTLSLRWEDGSTDDVYWTGGLAMMVGRQEGFETDAGLVHLQRDARGRLVRGFVGHGTFIEPWAPTVREKPEVFVIGG